MPPIVSNAHNWRQVRGIDFVFSGRWFRCRKKNDNTKQAHTQTSETITRAHTTATTVKRESYPLCRVCECVCVVHYVSTQSNPQHTRTHTHTLGLCERVYTPCNICNIVWTGGREGAPIAHAMREHRTPVPPTYEVLTVLPFYGCVCVCACVFKSPRKHNASQCISKCAVVHVLCCLLPRKHTNACVCVCLSFSLSLYSSPFNGLWPRVQLTNTN